MQRSNMKRRSWFVFGTLVAVWAVLVAWQAVEHVRVRQSARVALLNRAKDISNTLGLLMRSQRFFGVISKERLESALNELVNPELHSIVLLNAMEEVVASAGAPIDLQPKEEITGGVHWGDQVVTLVNLVDLGTNLVQDLQRTNLTNLTIIMPVSELMTSFQTNRPPPRDPPDNLGAPRNSSSSRRHMSRRHPPGTNDFGSFQRPFWMKEDEYGSLIQKKGVHSFVLAMSTRSLDPICAEDLWMRVMIALLATGSVVGFGMAWRNLAKTAELQIRLVRASELNLRLKEMNLAAAGLAHETRNPLNIVRGLAQIISRNPDTPAEVREKSREIINETDRVTAQLNDFINYSRPREVRRASVDISSVVGEVVRALGPDLEEKQIKLDPVADSLLIEADEQLLRQALFNLVLNAVQAVPPQGEIRIHTSRRNNSEAFVEIADNGPGVSPEHRSEIFKPYFTTQQKGTGLGLAVVQQIVLAHGWEIECAPNHPKGAIFRIDHIKLAIRN